MTDRLSANTQAILLLTAPLLLGQRGAAADILRPTEYQQLARHLVDIAKQPADLLAPDAAHVIQACSHLVDPDRLRALLERGFRLSQAVERWQTRAIWVVSRADVMYPRCLKAKMKDHAPAVLYGCGSKTLLNAGGLAVLGSRRVSDELTTYAQQIGERAAKAGQTVVSSGAKGVGRAAMDGALNAAGRVNAVLAEELEREAMNRQNRDPLRTGRLVLVTEYDPSSRATAERTQQRNQLLYAFAHHALIVQAERRKGTTWAAAVEQLDNLHYAHVFVRSSGEPSEALVALQARGALPWPNPSTADAWPEMLREAVPADIDGEHN